MKLAEELPNTILHSRADSTTKKYLYAFRRWKSWCSRYSFNHLPANGHHIALYLQYLADSTGSKASVEEACNALAWIHSCAGLKSPVAEPFVKSTLGGLQRLLAKPVTKKKPVTVEMLEALVKNAQESDSLSDLRLATTCLLSFAGFFRFNELVNLRPMDIKIEGNPMRIHIVRSKIDQLRQDDEVVVARTNSATCPVAMLERYMARTKTAWDDQRFLFRPIQKSRKAEALRASGCISYTCLRDLFKRKLIDLGYQPDEFGLHSLRAGGASAAANAGVPDRLFKRHGRWKSDNAKDGYVEDSLERRLEVTKNLGLYLWVHTAFFVYPSKVIID